ncbi:MAG TPA: hypothetical protein VM146_01925 [Steroidobacteraceae bacterium]|nr:hypothetical protein [Steroidobacteraceae bacterium]
MSTEVAALPSHSTPQENLQRWLVIVMSVVGIGLAAYGLFGVWHSEGRQFNGRLLDTLDLTTLSAMLCIAWLIAWRAGRNDANLAMALAIAAIYLNGVLGVTAVVFGHGADAIGKTLTIVTYFIGGALFVRASLRFPHAITRQQIAESATVWGRWKPTRAMLTALLQPAVLWLFVGGLTLLHSLSDSKMVAGLVELMIIGLGIVFFYINYRAGDTEVRRKVLWFLAAAVATALMVVIMLAAVAAMGAGSSPLLRTVINLVLSILNSLAQLICIAAAVFYAGAVSPSLVIRKTMVFGLTTALLLFVFASVEVFLHHQLVHLLEVTDTLASSLIGGAFGLTFHPVKHYFEHLLDKVLVRHGKAATKTEA